MDIIDAGPLETDWLVYRNLGSERVGAVGDGLGYQSRAARMIGTSDLILQSWCFGAGSPGMAAWRQSASGRKWRKADIRWGGSRDEFGSVHFASGSDRLASRADSKTGSFVRRQTGQTCYIDGYS